MPGNKRERNLAYLTPSGRPTRLDWAQASLPSPLFWPARGARPSPPPNLFRRTEPPFGVFWRGWVGDENAN